MKPSALLALALAACGSTPPASHPQEIPFTPERPEIPQERTVAPYTGSDAFVLDAQARYRTGIDLQRKLLLRSCSGLTGVCHNQKEYPDMHTPGTFAALIGAPCNVQPGSWSTVFDRCERPGDRFRLKDKAFREIEIGWIDYLPGAPPEGTDERSDTSPGLHVVLQAPIPADVEVGWDEAQFIRTFVKQDGNVDDIAFASFQTNWHVLADRTHLVADVNEWSSDDVLALLASGIEQGDFNRNGTFGARDGHSVALVVPGKPEESYLVARLRGQMQGERVPGSRMPLANQPPSVPDMVALMCFIEGLANEDARKDPSGPIDYASCSYRDKASTLAVTGSGATWSGRIQPLLAANCGGCHGGATPQGGLDLVSAGARDRLLGASTQSPGKKLIQPGSPEKSYLWLKLSGDGSITGRRMPIDPLGGTRKLEDAELADIEAWIVAGALDD